MVHTWLLVYISLDLDPKLAHPQLVAIGYFASTDDRQTGCRSFQKSSVSEKWIALFLARFYVYRLSKVADHGRLTKTRGDFVANRKRISNAVLHDAEFG